MNTTIVLGSKPYLAIQKTSHKNVDITFMKQLLFLLFEECNF